MFRPIRLLRCSIHTANSGSSITSSIVPAEASTKQGLSKRQMPGFYSRSMVLPISQKPMFPNVTKSFVVRDQIVCNEVERLAASEEPYLGTFLCRDENSEIDTVEDMSEVFHIGTFCQIMQVQKSFDGAGTTVTLFPHRRIRLTGLEPSTQPSATYGSIINLEDEPFNAGNPVIKALTSEILANMKDLLRSNSSIKDQIASFSYNSGIRLMEEPSMLADFVASLVPYGNMNELQSILESLVVEERLLKSLVVLKKELSNLKLQQQINKDVEEKMAKARKEYYLMEHMKGIQKELGYESDGRQKLAEGFEHKMRKLHLPEHVRSAFEEEIARFRSLDPSAMEFNVSRNYLDWLTSIPWGSHSKDNLDLTNARAVLDSDHFGLEDVKDRIIEFLAVAKLSGKIEGKIICLNGPPGVGKTSIGKSVARALNRSFYRFSVGGLSDVSEIKGHRRTYVGAMPGKIIQGLKKVSSGNPLILVDEVDKISRGGFRGDPASAMLEVLDPEQNSSFVDHFLDVPVDLSRVLFMCTSNVLETIPQPLLDRMEVFNIPGYIGSEKREIAKRYLLARAREESGLKSPMLNVTDSAIDLLIRDYCRESGVRHLKKKIDRLHRSAALRIARGRDQVVDINDKNLPEFVGQPIFANDSVDSELKPGIAIGLAWNGMGGARLFVESVAMGGTSSTGGQMTLTGNVGKVMKESMQIAMTVAKTQILKMVGPDNPLSKGNIHIHVPEGALPKDGPSAGTTVYCSLISLALNMSAPRLALTGEISLSGKVLRVGGIKEKVIAAHRAGLKHVILPKANYDDYQDLETDLIQDLKVDFVSKVEEISRICFRKS